MASTKFIDVPQDSCSGGDAPGGSTTARSSCIGVGDSVRTSTAPHVSSMKTYNTSSVQSSNAFHLTRATNMDRTSQTGGFSNIVENNGMPQSTAAIEASSPQSTGSNSLLSSELKDNPMSPVTLDLDARRVRWDRELHRPQPSAFAESSRNAESRVATLEPEAENKRVITYAEHDDFHKIDEDENIRFEDIRFVTDSEYVESDYSDEDAEYKHETEEDELVEDDVLKEQHAVNKSRRVVTAKKSIRICERGPMRSQLENEKNQDLAKRSKEDAQRPLLVAEGVTCSFGDCSLKSPFRRTISAFFGRNKKGGRDVPARIWLHICRKHYQRTKYRDKDKYVNAQCDRIEKQFNRLEEWSKATLEAHQGPHIDYWTISLGKKEADYQASQKNVDGDKARAAKGKDVGKDPAPKKDKDKPFITEEAIDDIFDEEDNIWHAPAWLVALQGRRLSFEGIREVFAKLRLETQSIPNRTLPQVEFLPHLIFLGNYQPKTVTYAKKNLKHCGPKKRASLRKCNSNSKPKTNAVKIEESNDEEDEDDHHMDVDEQGKKVYNDGMSDADEDQEYHKRKRGDSKEEGGQKYQRRRLAGSVRRDNYVMADGLLQRGGFDYEPRQAPGPPHTHMDVHQPRAPLTAPDQLQRVRYIPSWQRLENNPLPAQDDVEDEVGVYQPPVFSPRGPAKKNTARAHIRAISD